MQRDGEIQAAVFDELEWDSRVTATDIGVSVHQCVVTLTGTVQSYAERLAAEAATHRLHGVLDVVNDIEVKIAGAGLPTDTEIALAMRSALARDSMVPADHIQTTVSDGWIQLEGKVDRCSQREEAEAVVGRLTGVRGVTNAIRVKVSEVNQ